MLLNVATAGAFACFYIAVTLIPATAASVIETGIGPLAIALLAFRATGLKLGELATPMLVLATASAVAISAARFHLAWLLCGLLAAPTLAEGSADPRRLLRTAALALVCISLPILLLQWGITLAPPASSAMLIAALPTVVFASDLAMGAALTPVLGISMSALIAATVFGFGRARSPR